MSRKQEKNPARLHVKLSDLKDRADWVQDSEVKNCEQCGTNFSVFTRKHHCRRCGHIMCSACCSKVPVENKKVRMCHPCQEHTGQRETMANAAPGEQSGGLGGWFGGRASRGNASSASREVHLDQLRMLPSRLVKKRPELTTTLAQGFGKLRIKAIEAVGLVAADINLIGKNASDPYIEFNVGEHQKSVGKTKVIKNTLTPRWNSTHSFQVYSPFAEVTMRVYDEDLASGDDVLGMASFPLSALVEYADQAQDVWIYLEEAPGQCDDHSRDPGTLPPGAKIGLGSYGVKSHDLGAIHLELTLEFDTEGEYLAHFVRESPPPAPQPDMDIDLLYGNIFAIQDQVWPVIGLVWIILALFQWEDLTRSRIALITWMACCYWPGVAPLVLHALILRHIWFKHSELSSSVPTEEPSTPRNKREQHEEKHAATLGWMGTVMNSSKLMMPTETKEWLRGIQNSMGYNAEMLDGIYGLFDWRDRATTKTVTYAVVVSFILHATILSFGYTLMLIGAVLFTIFTALWLDMMNAINGLLTYRSGSLSRIQQQPQTQVTKNKTD